jgi:protein-tyrosine-phosphatase
MYLLFVCSGNTCRSPLALAAWRAYAREAVQLASGQRAIAQEISLPNDEEMTLPLLSKRKARILAELEVDSAGLCAHDGDTAASFAQVIARSWGEDLEDHHARLFRAPDAKAHLILTMTLSQADVLRAHFGLDETQVRVLGSYLPTPDQHVSSQFAQMWGNDFSKTIVSHEHDILDPYGGSMEAYLECAGQIRRAIAALAHSLASRK